MAEQQEFQQGDRVRLLNDCRNCRAGEEGRVLSVFRDSDGSIISLTLLLDGDQQRARGVSVYLREMQVERIGQGASERTNAVGAERNERGGPVM